MALSKGYFSRGARKASILICVPVGLLPAARRSGWEPHLIVWCVCRYLAGQSQSVDRKRLHAFFKEHDLLRPSRLNAVLREGEGRFWIAKQGTVSMRPVLYLRGKARITQTILEGWNSPAQAKVAYLPVETLKGVARRRGSAYEALVGKADPDKGQPRSRFTQQVQTGVPPSTQRRWNRRAGTKRIPTAVSQGQVSKDYKLDTKYVEEGPSRIVETTNGERHLVRQGGNITVSRFESHGSRSLRRSIDRTLLNDGGSDSASSYGSAVRYTNDANHYTRLSLQGLEPRLRSSRGVMDQRPCWLYQTQV